MRFLILNIFLILLKQQLLADDPMFSIENKIYNTQDILKPLGSHINPDDITLDQFNNALTYYLIIYDAKVKKVYQELAFRNEYREAKALAIAARYRSQEMENEVERYYQRSKSFVKIKDLKISFDSELITAILEDIESGLSLEDISKKYDKEGTYLQILTTIPLSRSPYFEDCAYLSKKGEIQGPVRTSDGIHFFEYLGKISDTSISKISHILIRDESSIENKIDPSSRKKIYEIYEKLKKGGDFRQLALKYSEHKKSAGNYGVLPDIRPDDKILSKIRTSISTLDVGEYSAPIHCRYGWSIIKVLDKKDYLSKDQIRKILEAKQLSFFFERLKVKYHLKEHIENLKLSDKQTNRPIFNLGGKSYTFRNLLDFVGEKIKDESSLIKLYDNFLEEKILEEHISRQGNIEEEKIGEIDGHLFLYQTNSVYFSELTKQKQLKFFEKKRNLFRSKYGKDITFKKALPFINEEYRRYLMQEQTKLLLKTYNVKILNEKFKNILLFHN